MKGRLLIFILFLILLSKMKQKCVLFCLHQTIWVEKLVKWRSNTFQKRRLSKEFLVYFFNLFFWESKELVVKDARHTEYWYALARILKVCLTLAIAIPCCKYLLNQNCCGEAAEKELTSLFRCNSDCINYLEVLL